MNQKISWVLLVAILATTGALLIHTAKNKSLVYDEIIYAPAGLYYLKTGDLTLNAEHPPLQKYISGLPLLLSKAILPAYPENTEIKNEWHFGYWTYFKGENQAKALDLIFKSRIPSFIITLLIILVLFIFTSKHYGPAAGLIAASLVAFDPLVLGNGSLAMNDIFVAAFMFFAVISLPRDPHQKLGRYVLSGAFAGAAMATKFTGFVTPPTLILMSAFIWPWKEKGSSKKFLINCGALLWASFFVFALIYQFQLDTFWEGFQKARGILQKGNFDGFLLGDIPGWAGFIYYPIAFLIKTPLPLLGLWIFSAFILFREKSSWKKYGVWLIPISMLLAAGFVSRNHFGIRYFIPSLPIMAYLVGAAYTKLPKRSEKQIWLLLITWLGIETLVTTPNHLSYFNQIAGGSKNGFKWLQGSNQDWGQDLPALRKFLDQNGNPSVILSYFGSALPEAYGIQFQDLYSPSIMSRYREDPYNPIDTKKEYVVVSAHLLTNTFTNAVFKWLEGRPIDHRIGNTLFAYDVSNDVDMTLKIAAMYMPLGHKDSLKRQLYRALYLDPNNSFAPAALKNIKEAFGSNEIGSDIPINHTGATP